MTINTYLSIDAFNLNKLNAPIKSIWWLNGLKKQDLPICCLQEPHFRSKDTHRLTVKGWERYSIEMEIFKKLVAILISGKIDFKTKTIKEKNIENKHIKGI